MRAGQHVLRAIAGSSGATYPDCRLTDIAAHERTGREGVTRAGGSVTTDTHPALPQPCLLADFVRTQPRTSLTTVALQAIVVSAYTARSPFVHLVFEGADDASCSARLKHRLSRPISHHCTLSHYSQATLLLSRTHHVIASGTAALSGGVGYRGEYERGWEWGTGGRRRRRVRGCNPGGTRSRSRTKSPWMGICTRRGAASVWPTPCASGAAYRIYQQTIPALRARPRSDMCTPSALDLFSSFAPLLFISLSRPCIQLSRATPTSGATHGV
ncbi:hypothetical protein B0H10DRAFT_642839 [Mycena sp. CBHHK59/15]|nr:hypothetical protein B0H10DRAFT_642839 [Mycena sp. CBHHK59/15]